MIMIRDTTKKTTVIIKWIRVLTKKISLFKNEKHKVMAINGNYTTKSNNLR